MAKVRIKLQDQPALNGATHIEEDVMGRLWEGILSDDPSEGLFKERQRISRKNANHLIRAGKRVWVSGWSRLRGEIELGLLKHCEEIEARDEIEARQEIQAAVSRPRLPEQLNKFEQRLNVELDLKFAAWLRVQKQKSKTI